MVGPFEQAVLALMIFVIMLGMGASLTPRDFVLTFKRPYAILVGIVAQFGLMPLVGVALVALLPLPAPIAVGLLIMSCMPGGTTSNIFTYFAKGNLALSMLMTVASTVAGVALIPLVLLLTAAALDLAIPRESVVATLVLLLVPALLGMGLRRLDPNAGAVTEVLGSGLAIVFILLLVVTWVPRNWQFLLTTTPATYVAAIGLGASGMALAYLLARLLRFHRVDAQTVSLEIGIQNGPLAIAIVAFTFGEAAQPYMAVPALYALFIVVTATLVTLLFRRFNTAAEQRTPKGLL